MKVIKNITLLLLPLYVLSTWSVFADQLKRMEDSWYVGGALGEGFLDPVVPDGTSASGSKGISTKLYAGVDISNQIGIEAFWTNFGKSVISGSAGEGSIKYSAIGLGGVYHLPIYAGRVHSFGKLGIAKIRAKSTGTVVAKQENAFSLFTGVGAEYDYNKNLKIRAEYEYFTKDISQISVGVNWSPSRRIHFLDQSRRRAIPAALPMNFDITSNLSNSDLPSTKKKQVKKVVAFNSSLSGNSLFSSGSSRLLSAGVDQLNQLIHKIRKSDFMLYHIVIAGHTDNRGSYAKNLYLSRRRATEVANYLASQGIARSQMSVIGHGESLPVSTNKTTHGRSLNRRVDISIKGASSAVATRQN